MVIPSFFHLVNCQGLTLNQSLKKKKSFLISSNGKGSWFINEWYAWFLNATHVRVTVNCVNKLLVMNDGKELKFMSDSLKRN